MSPSYDLQNPSQIGSDQRLDFRSSQLDPPEQFLSGFPRGMHIARPQLYPEAQAASVFVGDQRSRKSLRALRQGNSDNAMLTAACLSHDVSDSEKPQPGRHTRGATS